MYTRNKNVLLKNDEDIEMKKAQKQDVIWMWMFHNG